MYYADFEWLSLNLNEFVFHSALFGSIGSIIVFSTNETLSSLSTIITDFVLKNNEKFNETSYNMGTVIRNMTTYLVP